MHYSKKCVSSHVKEGRQTYKGRGMYENRERTPHMWEKQRRPFPWKSTRKYAHNIYQKASKNCRSFDQSFFFPFHTFQLREVDLICFQRMLMLLHHRLDSFIQTACFVELCEIGTQESKSRNKACVRVINGTRKKKRWGGTSVTGNWRNWERSGGVCRVWMLCLRHKWWKLRELERRFLAGFVATCNAPSTHDARFSLLPHVCEKNGGPESIESV